MAIIKNSPDKKTICKPKVCPTCNGLECFERPRYFCGQLLTDKDLDAAQRYVIEKNRLHNRYLVGTGVVCGLAVRCDPCNPCAVTIEPGYAIDCCGNDIVLCDPAPFNVCDYIDKCLREKEPACEEKIRPLSRCDDLPKEYCLILSYAEEPSRPMTALIRDNGCTVNCCEPSRTKEIYRFDLIKKEDLKQPKAPNLWDKLGSCFDEWKKLGEQLSIISTERKDPWPVYCRIKEGILKLYRVGPNIRCNLETKLSEIEADTTFKPAYQAFILYSQFVIDCICDALLVPCVECEEPIGVVLACLTVGRDGIERICNLARPQLLTGPALRYWLGPIFNWVNGGVEELCCVLDMEKLLTQTAKERLAAGPTVEFLGRIPALFERVRGFATVTQSKLKTFQEDLWTFLDPQAIHAADYLNLDAEVVQDELGKKGFTVRPIKAKSREAAHDLRNLARMAWVLPLIPGTVVEVLQDPETGKVTLISFPIEEPK
jgi:hypothetical protein